MVVYAYKNDITLDDWLEDFASRNNTYIRDSKRNFIHMVESLNEFQKKGKIA